MHLTFHPGEFFTFFLSLGEVNLGNQELIILSEKMRQYSICYEAWKRLMIGIRGNVMRGGKSHNVNENDKRQKSSLETFII